MFILIFLDRIMGKCKIYLTEYDFYDEDLGETIILAGMTILALNAIEARNELINNGLHHYRIINA